MQIRKENKKYLIVHDYEHMPIKLPVVKTQKTLIKLEKALSDLNTTLKDLYKNDDELYRVIRTEVFDSACLSLEEGRSWPLKDLEEGTRKLREDLESRQDEIIPYEKTITIQDLGYRQSWHNGPWEKLLEDTEEKEVAEEIQYPEQGRPVRRIRTTLWEKTDYGRSSKSITYRKIPIGKKLMQAIENSKEQGIFR